MSIVVRTFSAFLVFSLLLVLISCDKTDSPVKKSVKVSATKAYEQYFGPAPTVEQGPCFAFVIFFPSAKEPGKVIPFPFFTFDEGSIKKVALERLLGGMEVASYKGETGRPFPHGTRILQVSQAGGTITVDFTKQAFRSEAGDTVSHGFIAAAHTLFQFPGVNKVQFTAEGKASGMVDGKDVGAVLSEFPAKPDPASVIQPSPPRVLGVTGVKDKGATTIEDIQIYFDRPVEIRDVTLSDAHGNPFKGEMYQSVFDMAAVFKPKEVALFKAGMPVKVRWDVVDKVGRAGRGEQNATLAIKEH